MEFIVERKKKEYKSEFLFGELESRKEIKIDNGKLGESKRAIFEKYIESKEFRDALDNISSSQLNRFYSILEGRNFSFQSNNIGEFVEEQIKRNEENDGTKKFYEFFKANFLDENIFDSENAKNREIFEMIKRYVRYSIGQKKLKGEEGEN